MKLVSIVIRTLNEGLYLEELLIAIENQRKLDFRTEVVIVDSGSSDSTISIAEKYNCRITYIAKNDFTFGRSLNVGSRFANGEILVFISGHCIPVNDRWLQNLILPILEKKASLSYGGQTGRDTTKYSEDKIFKKYFPNKTLIPQKGFFCNNANSALDQKVWSDYLFNEMITGLEDMELAKRITKNGLNIAYVSDASVYHIHNESWSQTKRRYEREAIALQQIMPEVKISFFDMARYIFISIISDSKEAMSENVFFTEFFGIIKFRLAQYYGSYRGNHEHRELSKKQSENYFYPTKKI